MIETLKTLSAIQVGRKMSVTEPLLTPYFSARVASGHRHLLRIRAIPSKIIAITAMSKIQLKVLVIPA